MTKTKEELEAQIALAEAIRIERSITDKLYAVKLVEKLVFGMVGLILIAVIGAWIALVLTK